MRCPKCGAEGAVRNGTGRGLCRANGTRHSFIIQAEQETDPVLAARRGWAPEHQMVHPVAPGYAVKGTSTLYGDDGSVRAQWVKTTADQQAQQEAIEAALAALVADLPRVAPRKASGVWSTDLLTAYPIGDPHIGMYSWAAETGEDWDLELARKVHCSAMDALVQAAPATEQAIIVNLGDALHYDSMEAKTPRSGHMLDADGRYAKVIDVAVMTIRQCIESALTKHKFVHVVNVRGNHDETGAMWLARLLAIAYEREPRVTVDVTPSVFNYYRWGKVLIGMHHGHSCKPDKLPGVMAADRASDWGECTWRYWWQGHIHHESKKEYPGVSVESFNTLAAKDAYANDGGWRSGRTMQAIVLHREHGEVARSRVNSAMFEERAA
jgi:hypothetical protein